VLIGNNFGRRCISGPFFISRVDECFSVGNIPELYFNVTDGGYRAVLDVTLTSFITKTFCPWFVTSVFRGPRIDLLLFIVGREGSPSPKEPFGSPEAREENDVEDEARE
jgi:hypothetical protein